MGGLFPIFPGMCRVWETESDMSPPCPSLHVSFLCHLPWHGWCESTAYFPPCCHSNGIPTDNSHLPLEEALPGSPLVNLQEINPEKTSQKLGLGSHCYGFNLSLGVYGWIMLMLRVSSQNVFSVRNLFPISLFWGGGNAGAFSWTFAVTRAPCIHATYCHCGLLNCR